jgi:predicted component of type VI protein secretion system
MMSDLYRKATTLPDCTMNKLAEAQAAEAIAAFAELGLDERPTLVVDTDVMLFPWQGSHVQATLISALRQRGLIATPTHIAITVLNTTVEQVNAALTTIANGDLPAPEDMARSVKRPVIDKFDDRLGPFLQRRNYASARFDLAGARAAAKTLVTP